MTGDDDAQVRQQLAQAQARISLLESGVQERQALLEHARDLLEEHGAHGDDWPDIAPAIERVITRMAAAEAERDRLAAGIPLICCDERHEAKVRGLTDRLARVEAQWAQDVRSLDRIRHEWRQQDERLKAALRTDEHHMTMWGGLPFCSCRLSLAGGDATGAWITHRLAAVRELLDANSQSATSSSQIRSCPDPALVAAEEALTRVMRLAETLPSAVRAQIGAAIDGPAEQPAKLEPAANLHARCAHPGWEYATTEGPRKQWYDADIPPEGDGWTRNIDKGRDGWERWDYTEESYWRRPHQRPVDGCTCGHPGGVAEPVGHSALCVNRRRAVDGPS